MRRRWVTGVVLVWAAGLLVAGVWSARSDPPTVRPQSDLAAGRQTLDQAVAAVVAAADPVARADLEPYQVTTGCRITLSRRGTEVDRTVVLSLPAGQEELLLERLIERLPPEWGARYLPGVDSFFADAGEFVAIRGGVEQPGEVRLTAATGCRAGSDADLPSATP